jgi:hypothetical protein
MPATSQPENGATVYKARVKAAVKCPKHPRHNPDKDGRGPIKGDCVTCNPVVDAYRAVLSIRAAQQEVEKCASS